MGLGLAFIFASGMCALISEAIKEMLIAFLWLLPRCCMGMIRSMRAHHFRGIEGGGGCWGGPGVGERLGKTSFNGAIQKIFIGGWGGGRLQLFRSYNYW